VGKIYKYGKERRKKSKPTEYFRGFDRGQMALVISVERDHGRVGDSNLRQELWWRGNL
jgi:hypothetical protein